jgi:hypothetical protein
VRRIDRRCHPDLFDVGHERMTMGEETALPLDRSKHVPWNKAN